MAVYSPITKKELIVFLEQYNIGSLIKFEGILEGIENTNYKITTSKDIYILTIFEKRVDKKDLPFFINLKNHLVQKKFLCPKPISNKIGKNINIIKNKSCVLISYLQGKKVQSVSAKHCEQVGEKLSLLHEYGTDFKHIRENKMNYTQWQNIFSRCKTVKNNEYGNLFNFIERELIFLKENWPNSLPKGVIHADVFQDNVFFIDNNFSGLIDFYFSCTDYYAYDLALTINAWCFDYKRNFSQEKFMSLIKGYKINRNLSNEEIKSLSILSRGAAIRILLTRIHDKIFHTDGAYVEPKNPEEYEKILKFHQKNNLSSLLL
tara:strand:+ start:285 stop:1241 length:957 start_codon:yes stop_codon:yes gene_type:complete